MYPFILNQFYNMLVSITYWEYIFSQKKPILYDIFLLSISWCLIMIIQVISWFNVTVNIIFW